MIDYSRPFELIRRIGKLGVCLEQDDCLSELNETIEQLVKERDAAFDDIPHQCFYCKKAISCGEIKGTCKEWEWRGVHDKL